MCAVYTLFLGGTNFNETVKLSVYIKLEKGSLLK